MSSRQFTAILFIYGLAIIPAVHFIAPMLYPEAPAQVATSGGSIMGKTNVYIQLIPYVFAWLSAPLAMIWASVRTFKKK